MPELALIGLDVEIVVMKFGEPDLTKNNCIVYSHNNKALILKIANKKVKWLKYIHLKEGVNLTENESIFKF